MSEFFSRVVLTIEATIICLPLTALFLIGVLPAAFHFSDPAFMGVSFLIILPTIFSAWFLMGTFVFRGREALRELSSYWWIFPFLSAGLAIVVTVHLTFATSIEPSAINGFGWGLPFLIPLLHLSFELWFRSGVTNWQQ